MRALLALPFLVPLAGCDVDPLAARAVLKDEGLSEVVLSHVPYLERPCLRSEVYALRFSARREGRRVNGVLCATGDGAQDAVLRGEFDVDRRWRWDGAR